MTLRTLLREPHLCAALLALASAGILGAALFFQYALGYAPCVLCIWQRWPYVAVMVFGAIAVLFRPWRGVATAMLAASALALLANAGIAGYHVGVEQHWWASTSGCGVPGAADSLEALRAQIMSAPVVRCDEPSWTLFGVSMAGYNVVLALAMAAFAIVTGRIAYTRSPA